MDLDKIFEGDFSDLTSKRDSSGVAGSGSADSFVAQYAPVADRVAERTGVAPDVLLAQWGLETGWGKSVVPGTNNLGNIKDFSSGGVSARDNQTGSVDRYARFKNAEDFADRFSTLLQSNRYRNALGSGDDVQAYGRALKAGGYAEDPHYVSKLESAYQMVQGMLGKRTQDTRDRLPFNPAEQPLTDTGTDLAARRRREQLSQERGIVGDTMKTIAAGATGGVQTLTDLGYAVTGADVLNNASKGLGKVTDSINESMSPEMQEAKDKTFFGDKNNDAWTDPRSYWYAVFNGVGSMIPMLPMGGVGGKVAQGAMGVGKLTGAIDLAASTAEKVSADALKRGIAKDAALALGQSEGEKVFATEAAKIGVDKLALGEAIAKVNSANTVGMTVAGTAMTAGDAANGAMEEVDRMSHQQLMDSPDYRALLGDNPDDPAVQASAKEEIKRAAGREAAAVGSAAALPANAVVGRVMERLLHGGLGASTRLGNVARAAGAEVPSEALEEGSTQWASNVGVRNNANPNKDTSEGVADMAFKGALGSAGMAAPHAIHAGVQAPQQSIPQGGNGQAAVFSPEPQPVAVPIPNSPLTNAANAATRQQAATQIPEASPASVAPFGDADLDRQWQDVSDYINNRENIQALRNQSPDLPGQAFHVWNNVINNTQLPLRSRIQALEQAHSMIQHLPNFTMGSDENVAAGQDSQTQSLPIQNATRGEVVPARNEIDMGDAQVVGNQAFARPALENAAGTPSQVTSAPQEITDTEQPKSLDSPIPPRQRDDRFADIAAKIAAGWVPGKGLTIENAQTGEVVPVTPAEKAVAKQRVRKKAQASNTRQIENSAVEPVPATEASVSPGAESNTQSAQPSAGDTQERPVAALGIDSAKRTAAALSRQGFPSKVIPHPTVPGRYAVVGQAEAGEAIAEAPKVETRKEEAPKALTEREQALAELGEGIDELVGLLGVRQNMLPEDEAHIIPVMSKIFRAAAKLGYVSFKEAARFVVNQVRQRYPEAADKLTIENLQAGYINIAKEIGSDKKEALAFDSVGELMADHDTEREQMAAAEERTDTAPTEAQKEAGNYAKGKFKWRGQTIAVENPVGSVRRGIGADGNPWEVEMPATYGYFKGTVGADKDHVDVFMGPNPQSPHVWVINQKNLAGGFDEHKVMSGFDTPEQAKQAYLDSFSDGFGEKVFDTMSGEIPVDKLGEVLPELSKRESFGIDESDVSTKTIEPTSSLNREPASWVIRDKSTGEAIMETFDKAKVDSLNAEKYEAVPIIEHLESLNRERELSAQGDTTRSSENSRLNMKQTVNTADILTPAGAIKSEATNGAGRIWYHQGDPNHIQFAAKVTFGGQPAPEHAIKEWQRLQKAQELGYRLTNRRAGRLGTVWTLDKDKQTLTHDGFESIDSPVFERPDRENAGPGYDNMASGQAAYATKLATWFATLPESTLRSASALSTKINQTPIGEWVKIQRDRNGQVRLDFEDKSGKLDLHMFGDGSYLEQVRRIVALAGEAKEKGDREWFQVASDAGNRAYEANQADTDVSDMLEQYGFKEKQKTAESAPATQAQGPIESHDDFAKRLYAGELGEAEYKATFDTLVSNKQRIIEELSKLTKDKLLSRLSPMMASRYKSDRKDMVVRAAWDDMLGDFRMGRTISYAMGPKMEDGYLNAVKSMVEKTTAEDLKQFSDEMAAARNEREQQREAITAAVQDPKTLEDFWLFIRSTMADGNTEQEARLALSPEQRVRFDDLGAEASRYRREHGADARRSEVRVAATTTDGQIIETKHTRDGYDLFVVKAADRVDRDVYNQWNATAKSLGGWYSSFRGNGAVPGFQFKTKDAAQAFLEYIGGNTESAKEELQARRDAFEDDRSQTAVERLSEMADRLEDRANESLAVERKANTARRARFAASAEAASNADKAMALTMRKIADGISNGTAKFLDRVRQKVQVEMLDSAVRTAQYTQLTTKYSSYYDYEKHRGEAPNDETADFARFPSYTAYRSDLARLGRQMEQIDGAKKLAQRLLSVADDVTDEYKAFAKENWGKLTYKLRDGGAALLPSMAAAEATIRRSGFRGRAIAFPVKRGTVAIIMSPAEAKERGAWKDDSDKRITLTPEFAEEVVAKVKSLGKRSGVDLPWVFDNVSQERARLKALGLETPAEFRAALREFIRLRERPAAPDRIKEMERAMVGRKNDGLDFFPTSAGVAQEMIEAADIKPGMSVLEPSAGMGHIAEQIRDVAEVDPDVVEMDSQRRDLLEAKGFHVVGRDFMDMSPRGYTYGDVFRRKTDGVEGVMRGSGGIGSNRVGFHPIDANGKWDERNSSWEDRDDLEGIRKTGVNSGYDRIIMNPPFSDRRDAEHVMHAYSLLRPGGRLVAIMGEGVFFGQDKRAQQFRDWLDSVGGTSEKLEEGSFMDPSLPVNTGVNARMVVVDKPEGAEQPTPSVAENEGTDYLRPNDQVPDGSLPDIRAQEGAGRPLSVRLDPSPEARGVFGLQTVLTTTREVRLGREGEINSPRDAATALGFLTDFAAEHFDALVTDERGKPLAVIGSFKGRINQTPVYVDTVMREAIRIPGAAEIWFAHNHPTGNPTLSDADLQIANSLHRVFSATKIKPMGMISIARQGKKARRWAYTIDGSAGHEQGVALEPSGNSTVPVQELTIGDSLPLIDVGSGHEIAAKWIPNIANGNPTVVFLNEYGEAVGAYPVTAEIAGRLRTDHRIDELVRAISVSNASRAIVANPDWKLNTEQMRNLSTALDTMGVQVQDWLNYRDDDREHVTHSRLTGEPMLTANREFYSLGGRESNETATSIRAALAEQFGEEGIRNLERAGVLRVVDSQEEVPEPLRNDSAEAVYDSATGTAWLVANRITPARAAKVLLHEIGEHYGLKSMLGERGWSNLAAQVKLMARKKGSLAESVWNGVKEHYPEFQSMDDSALAKSDRFIHEVIAKLGENADIRKKSIWRDLMSMLKRFMVKLGFTGKLNEDDVAELVRGSLMKVMGDQGRFVRYDTPQDLSPSELASAKELDAWAKEHPLFSNQASMKPVDTDSPQFKRWFGNSKVVDDEGNPLVVYHGGAEDFSVFDMDRVGSKQYSDWGDGIYLTPSKYEADSYRIEAVKKVDAEYNAAFARYEELARDTKVINGAPQYSDEAIEALKEFQRIGREKNKTESGKVFELYASIKRPFIQGYTSLPDPFLSQHAKERGYDGIFVLNEDGSINEIIAFRPEQIKSAISNTGEFDANDPSILHSIQPNNTRLAAETMMELSGDDRLFTFKASKATSLQSVFRDVYPDATYYGEHTREDERAESGADHRYVLTTHDVGDGEAKTFYVYTKDSGRQVWVDVSRLEPGDGGQQIYAAVLNWAHNNRYVLVGDPNGVSKDATIRRTTAMMASALRFGTTQHMEPSDTQRKGDRADGIEPLKWEGNDFDNLKALIHTFTTILFNKVPALNGYYYDFSTNQFRDRAGRPVRADRFAYAGGNAAAREASAGGKTLRRGIFLKSLLELGPEEESRVVDSLYRRPDQIVDGVKPLFSIPFEPSAPSIFAAEERSPSKWLNFLLRKSSDALKGSDKFGWLDKSIHTQLHKAEKNPYYGAVFKRLQLFMSDASRAALRPAEMAPTVLPRIDVVDSIAGAVKSFVYGKEAAADVDAAFQAVLRGTLDDKVFSNAQEAELTEKQFDIYREYRDSIDASLDELSASEAWQIARTVFTENGHLNEEGLAMKKATLDNPTEARDTIAGAIADKIDSAKLAAESLASKAKDVAPFIGEGETEQALREAKASGIGNATQTAAIQKALDAYSELHAMEDVHARISAVFDRRDQLQAEGYAPLMRFGQHYLHIRRIDPMTGEQVTNEEGEPESEFFGLFESEAERDRALREFQDEYRDNPNVEFDHGTMSEEGWRRLKGVSPESIALFAEKMGIDKDEVFQQWYRHATNNRSALKRLIHRKGTPGFSTDGARVLASFLTSNGRRASMLYHTGDINEAIEDFPKQQGAEKDEAIKLAEYVQNPQEEAAGPRSLMFMHFLGGSVSNFFINATQPAMVTLPYLARTVGMRRAMSLLKEAYKLSRHPEQIPAEVKQAMEQAEQEGIVGAQEIFHLWQETARPVISKLGKFGEGVTYRANAFMQLWGMPFALAEHINRRVTFISAYNAAKESGQNQEQAYNSAINAVNETQFVYGRQNRPNAARGSIGSLVFTFKLFSISYVELLTRMLRGNPESKKAALWALGILIMAAGVQGLPGADDLDDLYDTIAQMLGYNVSAKKAKRKWLESVAGKEVAQVILYGLSSLTPLDVSSRMGLGNLIPATGLLKPSNDKKFSDLLELVGPVGGLAQAYVNTADAVSTGDWSRASTEWMPKTLKDLTRGAEMAVTGEARDGKGRKVQDVSMADAMVKMIGFNPQDIASSGRKMREVQQQIDFAKRQESLIADKWANGIVDGNPEAVRAARKSVAEWNATNPDTPIGIKLSSVQRRVKEMKATKHDRFLKSATKEMRETVAEDID